MGLAKMKDGAILYVSLPIHDEHIKAVTLRHLQWRIELYVKLILFWFELLAHVPRIPLANARQSFPPIIIAQGIVHHFERLRWCRRLVLGWQGRDEVRRWWVESGGEVGVFDEERLALLAKSHCQILDCWPIDWDVDYFLLWAEDA